jgi:hypothetical protein
VDQKSVQTWYCNACSWQLTVIDGKRGQLTGDQVRSEFANHVCKDSYGQRNAEINVFRQSGA